MYKIINQLTNQEETFEHRDDLFSKLEIINERMKSNRITGTYRLYSLNSEGEILQEESLDIPFIGIIDQLLENFGTSVGKKKRGLLHFLEKHKENTSLLAERESQSQPEPELEELTVKREANMARQIIAELVSQKPQDEVGEEVPLEDKNAHSSSEWTTEDFSRLDKKEEELVEASQDMPTQEVVSIVEKSTQEEKIPLSVKEDKGNVEPSFSLSHVTSVNLPSEVIDSFEAQTVTYKQSIKHKIQSNEEFIKEANEEINECQNKINELRQQILAKEKQASQLKDLYYKIEEVS
ncbi:TPA: hypothetical protein V1G48_001047 [Streptococcus pneumoniae]|jgi:hypothetical protein|uniref:hypothetical protein n=1 Tax=Streptococcus TaxID=1301 RepID=UPI0010EFD298|nr:MULTISPECIES: hypothetical protein [Streptococcus]CAG5284441.1 Uncharacterised protein [Streptococcus pneumoniae]VJF40379.1 Uncharacterised protein [Streptococcus pneumoniae]VKQ62027.1 Uncharacterised protein [Streptococcus pneumoniae]VLD65654.1 Uncharacterised protein [Streptococcus pneumoniae]VSL26483.1 Uncharacterised protein [Streptococcus pneumoniae]